MRVAKKNLERRSKAGQEQNYIQGLAVQIDLQSKQIYSRECTPSPDRLPLTEESRYLHDEALVTLALENQNGLTRGLISSAESSICSDSLPSQLRMLIGLVGNSTRLELPTRPRTAPGGEFPDSVLILSGFRPGKTVNAKEVYPISIPPRPRIVPGPVTIPGGVSHPVTMRIRNKILDCLIQTV